MRKVVIILMLWVFPFVLYSQDEDLFNMSLEELLNVEIVSASKKAENIFDAPLSSTSLTKEEIEKSGAESIMEALRLIPGVIVREQTNGNYDIHLRGLDYVPPHSSMPYTQNLITLVMIDNRVVFRDFQGGTYWEALPISLADVERIEVVRGPSSALYGPNAVAGVINIITKREKNDGFHVLSESPVGTDGLIIERASVSYKNEKFSVDVSGNYEKRDRFQETYYEYYRGIYVDSPDSIKKRPRYPGDSELAFNNADQRYPDPSNAVDKFGINGFFNYKLNDDVSFDLSAGIQESEVQKVYVEVTYTPLTTEKSETQYVNFLTKFYGAAFQFSYLNGYQNTLGVIGWEYDFNNIDVLFEYDYEWNNLTLRPGFMYRKVEFDDEKGVENSSVGLGLINGAYDLTTTSFYIRSDWKPTEKLRLIGAVRADKYNYPDETYFSYQLASTYKINENNLLRFTVSRANKGSNILDTYVDFNYNNVVIYSGSKDLDLMTMDLFELGFRSKLSPKLHLDLELFYSQSKDFTSATVIDSVVGFSNYFSSQNLSVEPKQMGATIGFNYIPKENLQIKPYVTFQQTDLESFDPNITDMTEETIEEEHEWTPKYYGGLYINYMPLEKLNINVNSYFYDSQTFKYLTIVNSDDETELLTDEISGKFLINSKISYEFWKNSKVYLNARNLLSGEERQFAFADEIKPVYILGLELKF